MSPLAALERSETVVELIEQAGTPVAPVSQFDNRDTWDNRGGGGFDNRSTWDNWKK
ncbi:multiple cyclophane-containing RiPP AmcA [Actinorugispora endophytica]|uniref:Uncharacterized protein n=1 Tax=Actinorugispora endophytica TaxID=1605990 RepID=A0A4R6V8Z8_9ACTN|nr:multiple cyclophane-containing RiPP AmcA [Actinorugispora endophytica]TDQ52888.1 hypothetical protein EV190_1054 [Actinorugispora endophytica]